MRRSEREITDRAEIDAILRAAPIVHVAMVDGGEPYVVPLNFGYEDGRLFCHSAGAGRKIETLRMSPRVCFEVVLDDAVTVAPESCRSSARYRSVIGFGTVRFIEDRAEKIQALDAMMRKFAAGPFTYDEDQLARTTVFEIAIASVTGKKAGYA